MYDFQQRNKIKRIFYSRATIVFFCIITVLLVRGAYMVVKKEKESQRNVDLIEQKLILAREKKEELSKDIASIQTESGVEREIRNKFSVTKEGEDVAVIVDTVETDEDSNLTKKSPWFGIGQWIRGLFD